MCCCTPHFRHHANNHRLSKFFARQYVNDDDLLRLRPDRIRPVPGHLLPLCSSECPAGPIGCVKVGLAFSPLCTHPVEPGQAMTDSLLALLQRVLLASLHTHSIRDLVRGQASAGQQCYHNRVQRAAAGVISVAFVQTDKIYEIFVRHIYERIPRLFIIAAQRRASIWYPKPLNRLTTGGASHF
ncbi:hypothetical protein BC936DRAFT_138001, partial [Jimgerdemannia flammicorona]